jgi:hypothetical protein
VSLGGEHAGVPDTSRLLFIDTQGTWVRRDKMAPGGEWSKTGVDGDPRQASADLGERFMAICVQGWAKEIRRLIDKGNRHARRMRESTDALVKSADPSGKVSQTPRVTGQVLWRESTTHTAENVGKTEARALAVELKPCP